MSPCRTTMSVASDKVGFLHIGPGSGKKSYKCSECQQTWYCSQRCQVRRSFERSFVLILNPLLFQGAHWKEHKPTCLRRKQAADETETRALIDPVAAALRADFDEYRLLVEDEVKTAIRTPYRIGRPDECYSTSRVVIAFRYDPKPTELLPLRRWSSGCPQAPPCTRSPPIDYESCSPPHRPAISYSELSILSSIGPTPRACRTHGPPPSPGTNPSGSTLCRVTPASSPSPNKSSSLTGLGTFGRCWRRCRCCRDRSRKHTWMISSRARAARRR